MRESNVIRLPLRVGNLETGTERLVWIEIGMVDERDAKLRPRDATGRGQQ